MLCGLGFAAAVFVSFRLRFSFLPQFGFLCLAKGSTFRVEDLPLVLGSG